MGMPVKFELLAEAPGVINNRAMFKTLRDACVKVLGEKNVDFYSLIGHIGCRELA